MKIDTLQATGFVQSSGETMSDESIFFEIYDFDLMPPTDVRHRVLNGEEPNAVSVDVQL